MAAELTPLMQQYRKIKEQHLGEVLFFRLGDFYEMFDDDAVEISRLLNLTLTQRSGHPMCGVPHHASKLYIARLLRFGKKVAVCEQVGPVSKGKELTVRQVIEVITPGTVLEQEYLEQSAHNYLAAIFAGKEKTGFAYIDVATATFCATNWDTSDMTESFARELGRAVPRELLLPQSLDDNAEVKAVLASAPHMLVSRYPDWHFAPKLSYKRLLSTFGVANLRPFSLDESSPEVSPAGFLLDYLSKNSASSLPHISNIQVFRNADYLIIDDSSRRNLEMTENLHDATSAHTLLAAVNFTKTAMGYRLLKNWLLFPLRDADAVRIRQTYVRRFAEDRRNLSATRDRLASILDIERLAGRISMDRAHAKDVQALRASLASWLGVRVVVDELFAVGNAAIAPVDTAQAQEIIDLIERAILDEPSASLTEGNIIKSGWSEQLDRYREVKNNFDHVLDRYLDEERTKTHIPNLKIRYNRNIGYYIEISRGKLSPVPEHFILRRALVNGDRYTTERLQELEDELVNAEQNIVEEEQRLFIHIRDKLKTYNRFLFAVSAEIAFLDAAASFAHAALLHKWSCPTVDDSTAFSITKGRHPVVEACLPSGEFVPNDAQFESGKMFALVTGPNMAGKSTYLRQNALIALLAQTGSFVPAEQAHIGIIDRIFCRVGASDNLARGESTFLVEMSETAYILRSATARSLVIMDEVGRGTSTADGLAIARAVSEHLLNALHCKTFFATHYHELTRLPHPACKLLCLEVLEREGTVVFLKKIREGASTASYGIHVARLAGVPESVITRARTLLAEAAAAAPLPASEATQRMPPKPVPAAGGLFSGEELIIDEILSLDSDAMTPLAALALLSRWQKTLTGGQ